MFQFAWPWVLLLLPLPVAIYLWLRPAKEEKISIIIPFYQQLISTAGQPSLMHLDKKRPQLFLVTLIWLLAVLAAARPQWVGEAVAINASGRDLLVAVDISDSMDQADMEKQGQSVSRLTAVKAVVSDFIERREGDRIGLVLFGTNAYLQTPLTFDTKTVAQFLEEAQLGFAGPKTAIGDAIGLSVKRLQKRQVQTGDDQVLILLTDGANTAGEVEPLQAAELAEQTNVKIYTVGIGADEMLVRSLFGTRRINPSAQLDERTLVTIAETTGGKYFRARDTKALNAIYQELDKLEPLEQEKEWLRPTRALFMWPLAIAFLFSILSILFQLTRLTKHQTRHKIPDPAGGNH